MTDIQLEGEGGLTDEVTALQHKLPDAWAIRRDKYSLFILEFTRPNDRCTLFLEDTDLTKAARYASLAQHLPTWEIDIIMTITLGKCWSHSTDKWLRNLNQL